MVPRITITSIFIISIIIVILIPNIIRSNRVTVVVLISACEEQLWPRDESDRPRSVTFIGFGEGSSLSLSVFSP